MNPVSINNIFPTMSVKSRYSLVNPNSSYYSALQVSGNSIGNKGSIGQGYIFVPYIMATTSSVIVEGPKSSEMLRRIRIKELRKERKEKTSKLKW